MTIAVNDIKWGAYSNYEGAFWPGKCKFNLSTIPKSDNANFLAVVTSTEGGAFDAINAYDRCIISAGLLQFCEAGQFSVSSLLGSIYKKNPELLLPLQDALNASNARFAQNANGKYRFFFNDSRGEVDTTLEQQQLFLLNSNGHKGTWDSASKSHVKLWAASVANVLSQPEAQLAQVDFIFPRLLGFVFGDAKTILFGASEPQQNQGWVGAARAIFLSYAVNLPLVATNQLKAFLTITHAKKWSEDWVKGLARQMTFGPNIAIYPHRYNAIRPVVEKIYDVNLPDFAEDLKKWEQIFKPDPDPTLQVPLFTTIKEIQTELIAEGYDLGPAGADGIEGTKTKLAVRTFQSLHDLFVDGIVGKMTRNALVGEWKKRIGV